MPGYVDLLNEALRIVASLEYAEGEVTPEMEERLTAFVDGCEDKLSALRSLAFHAHTQSSAVEEEIRRLRRLKAHYDGVSAAVHRQAYTLAKAMSETGEDPNIKGVCAVKTTRRANFPKDPDVWPDAYKTEVTSYKLDTAGLKRDVKAGEAELPEGFKIDEHTYIKFDGVKTPS